MLNSIRFHIYFPKKWNFSEMWVNFKIWFNWMWRELCSRSPLPIWSGAALLPTPCGWCCFPPSSFGVVLRNDRPRPTVTMGTIDTDRRRRWWRSSPSDTDRHDGDGYPIFFLRLCCFSPLFLLGGARILTGWCCVTLRLSGGAAPPTSLSPPSFMSFRAVLDPI